LYILPCARLGTLCPCKIYLLRLFYASVKS
jgi:hypothetical protein